MVDAIIEFFSYGFVRNAIIASALISILVGFIGTYVVSRRLVFLSGGITHASFGGIGIAWYLGWNPLLGAAIFSIVSAVGIEYLTGEKRLREDSAIGMLWALGMALGVFFVFLTPGYAPDLMSYLFGNILTISTSDNLMLLVLSLVTALFFTLFYYPILFLSFDEEYVKTQHVKARVINFTLKILVALAIVLSIRAIGIILVISLLTLPANIANLFTKRFGNIIWLSALICFGSTILGIILSYRLNVPSGATIVIALALIYLLTRFYFHLKGAIFRDSLRKGL